MTMMEMVLTVVAALAYLCLWVVTAAWILVEQEESAVGMDPGMCVGLAVFWPLILPFKLITIATKRLSRWMQERALRRPADPEAPSSGGPYR